MFIQSLDFGLCAGKTTRVTTVGNASRAPVASSGSFVALISLAAATGGLLFGFDTAVISGSQKFFVAEFDSAMR
jgi:hypothetical protein